MSQSNIFSSSIKNYIAKAQNANDARTKFQILEKIIDEFPANHELSEFFVDLISEVFGYGEYTGWRLNKLDAKSHNDEVLYKKVYNFLHPFGHMFKLINKLNNENITVELSASLPPKVLGLVQANLMQSLYQQRIGLPGNPFSTANKINALEYYLLMYFGYLLQPKICKDQLDWNKYSDILYVNLFEEYLAYFLPTGSSVELQNVLKPQTGSYFGWYNGNNSSRTPEIVSPTNLHLRTTHNQLYNNPYNVGARNIMSNTGLSSLQRFTSNSETFVQILSDLWLGQSRDSVDASHTGNIMEYSLPTVDQTLMIRIFIKHIHYFIYSGANSSDGNTHGTTTMDSQMEEFKKIILPTLVQKRLYLFLKNCFCHWPLDPSFKMVLETWLSYIQPWRYKDMNSQNSSRNADETDLEDWREFVEGNILFYTALFRMFISRMERFDLRMIKDVQMIQRVTKVFSQQNLAKILREGENDLMCSSSSPSINQLHTTRLGSTYPGVRHTSKQIDLEETGFHYEPIFDRRFINKIEELAQKMLNEAECLKQEQAQEQKEPANGGIIANFFSFFSAESNDEERMIDTKLMETLDRICFQLSQIFDFIPSKSYKTPFKDNSCNSSSHLPKPFATDQRYDDGSLLPEHVIGSDGSVRLTDKGRIQILQQMRHFEVQGKASFDLEPVRSYEIHSLVRWMYKLSTILNEKYDSPLREFYNREDIIGKVLRRLSPNVSHKYGQSVKVPGAVPVGCIQPRISLRFLASYYTVYYIGWLFLIFKLFGVGLIEALLLLILILILFALHNMGSCSRSISETE